MTLKQLEKKMQAVEKQLAQLATVERRVAKLEKNGRRSGVTKRARPRKNGSAGGKNPSKPILESKANAKTENERADEILRNAGLLATLPAQAKADAAAWRALPADEREKILQEFADLPLPKPLSDIILENRR